MQFQLIGDLGRVRNPFIPESGEVERRLAKLGVPYCLLGGLKEKEEPVRSVALQRVTRLHAHIRAHTTEVNQDDMVRGECLVHLLVNWERPARISTGVIQGEINTFTT